MITPHKKLIIFIGILVSLCGVGYFFFSYGLGYGVSRYKVVLVGFPPKVCYTFDDNRTYTIGCEDVSEKWCKQQKGYFEYCGSSCLGEKTKTICPDVCVPNCYIK